MMDAIELGIAIERAISAGTLKVIVHHPDPVGMPGEETFTEAEFMPKVDGVSDPVEVDNFKIVELHIISPI
jgi:hypothetical protein